MLHVVRQKQSYLVSLMNFSTVSLGIKSLIHLSPLLIKTLNVPF